MIITSQQVSSSVALESMMYEAQLLIEESAPLSGVINLIGAKNAVLVIMCSLILTSGKSILRNVPSSEDVLQMIELLQELGAEIFFDRPNHCLEIDTTYLKNWSVREPIMKKMRASALVIGPLLARFGQVKMALPGGCLIGPRPIDFHLKALSKMGATFHREHESVLGTCNRLNAARIVLEYPSVGATENIIMAAVLTLGTTTIINAALEPEVIDLVNILRKMGARIDIESPAMLNIEGVAQLQSVEYTVMPDRLEAGTVLLAAAITGGSVTIENGQATVLDVFLLKLEEIGHKIEIGPHGRGITLHATSTPRAVSLRTAPYPGFPTDLQAPMVAALTVASGTSVIQETVYENRFLHVRELQKMGAQIQYEGDKITVFGVEALYGARVIASDIRASAALVLAGLVAKGSTVMTGIHHWRRGYDALDQKLNSLGAQISLL